MVKVKDLCPASLGSIPTGTNHWWHLKGHPNKIAPMLQQALPWYLGTLVDTSETLNKEVDDINFGHI